MRVPLDHISNASLLDLHEESIRLRDEAFDEDAPRWALRSRVIRHDEIVQALVARGLFEGHQRQPRARNSKKR
jgi:hypothetical protein